MMWITKPCTVRSMPMEAFGVTLVSANRIVAISPDGRRAAAVVEDRGGVLVSGSDQYRLGLQDMCDAYIGSILTPYVPTGRSSVPGCR
jgi:hypothetical protein